MTPVPACPAWSAEALFNKALLYVGEMEKYTPDDWQFGFWASISLELIVRAALANISPTLLADRKSWRNFYHALGHPPTVGKFVATSITITEALDILHEILGEFSKELRGSCNQQFGRRNAELHSGEDSFLGLGTSSWLPGYYASCDVLLRSAGKKLSDLFSDADTAARMITALGEDGAKSVQKDIAAYRKTWEQKTEEERATSRAQAATWATREAGHRVTCPACESQALIHGSKHGPVTTAIGADFVVQKQAVLPSALECTACGLKITGHSKLLSCGRGDAFTSTSTLTTSEYFGLYTEEDLEEARAASVEPEFEENYND